MSLSHLVGNGYNWRSLGSQNLTTQVLNPTKISYTFLKNTTQLKFLTFVEFVQNKKQ